MTESEYKAELVKFRIFSAIKIAISIALVFTLLLIPISLILIRTIFERYSSLQMAKSNINYYNDNNDGIYHHFLIDKKDKYEIRINDNDKTIYLASGKKEKVYRYDEIKEWGFEINGIESTSGMTVVAGSPLQTAVAGSLMGAAAIGQTLATIKKAWEKNGFFIKTNDIAHPVWQIKFCNEKGFSISDRRYWDDVIPQCQSWMVVFNKVLNHE